MRLAQDENEKMINQSLAENGYSSRVTISCPGEWVVAPPNSDLYCAATVGNRPARLLVHVEDSRGNVTTRIIMGELAALQIPNRTKLSAIHA